MVARQAMALLSVPPRHWHMVLVRHLGHVRALVIGPWTTAGVVTYEEGAELVWIKFRLGTFMPHLPTRDFLDKETILPGAASKSFWLNGSARQFPDYENIDTFLTRLVRADTLALDPVVNSVVVGQQQELASRTLRHRFLRIT